MGRLNIGSLKVRCMCAAITIPRIYIKQLLLPPTGLAAFKYRHYSSRLSHSSSVNTNVNKYFVTTPIFYVNSVPHIGHLYTALLADAATRWHRLLGDDVLFSTGTDEHGLKIQQAAAAQQQSPQMLCDTVSREFSRLFEKANINYDDFIRTTEPRHIKGVHEMWALLKSKGMIYKGSYEGWYCVPDEEFLVEDQVEKRKDDKGNSYYYSLESGHPVEWMKEDNYMFKLSLFSDQLKSWLDTGAVQPANYTPDLYRYIDSGLPDLSISRSYSRLQWGIQVPEDNNQTIYVWLDALVNYLTVGGFPTEPFIWPSDLQIVGKDILKFHAIYWPAFLMAAGLEPPKTIHCHAHWLFNEEKMSKSKGNVVDPFSEIDRYGTDGLRFFLLREGVPHSDGNYFDKKVMECYNSELVNVYGNLLNRCSAIKINPDQIFPKFNLEIFNETASSTDKEMLANLYTLRCHVNTHFQQLNFYKGIDVIMKQMRDCNGYVQRKEPWNLKKDPGKLEHLNTVIYVSLETLRVTSVLLLPIIPSTAGRVLSRLNIPPEEWTLESIDTPQQGGMCLGKDVGILFPRIKKEKA